MAQVLRGGALDWCQGQSSASKRKAIPKEISGLPSPHCQAEPPQMKKEKEEKVLVCN